MALMRLAFLPLVLCLGCNEQRYELTGHVHYRGTPLASGTISLVGADGKAAHSAIGGKGQFILRDVPPGKARLSVKSHGAVPEALGGSKSVPIPARYGTPETSGLEVEV